jgi:hypothetical protein
MSPELEKEILDKYPRLFPIEERGDKNQQSLMYYGFSCGDGWYQIIDSLCRNIQFYNDQQQHNLDPEDFEHYQVVVEQVKEKFGSLRFYVRGGDEYVYGMIRMAEAISAKTCEYCGAKAEITTKGWIKNICLKCNDKNKKQE